MDEEDAALGDKGRQIQMYLELRIGRKIILRVTGKRTQNITKHTVKILIHVFQAEYEFKGSQEEG